MDKTTVYLPAELRKRLAEAARRRARPQADLIRDAIRAFLDSEPRTRPRFVGVVKGGGMKAADDERVLDQEWGGDADA